LGIIIELKAVYSAKDLAKVAAEAVKQIENRQYVAEWAAQGMNRKVSISIACISKKINIATKNT